MIEPLYHIPTWALALVMIVFLELVSLGGLLLVRRYITPRMEFHDGVNDAISGTVQSIGVFYGITVGLIAAGAWNNYQGALELASQEAASIGVLYRDAGSYPEPLRTQLRDALVQYTRDVVQLEWPAQRDGREVRRGAQVLADFQVLLLSHEPATETRRIVQEQMMAGFNNLVHARRLRIDAVGASLTPVMWSVIWIGAAITIAVGFFFHIRDRKLHMLLTGLTAAFIAIVLFIIVINSRPFIGNFGIDPDSYQLILDTM
jgi:hypothetical protein